MVCSSYRDSTLFAVLDIVEFNMKSESQCLSFSY